MNAPLLVVVATFSLVGCSSTTASSPAADSASPDVAVSDTGAAADGALTDTMGETIEGDGAGSSGSGTVTGAVAGTSFGSVATGFLIGAPDDPTTTAIYLVDKPASCADISKSGWSHTIAAGTHIFELIFSGTTTGTYKVAAVASAGQVEVNFVIAAPTKNETRGSAGSAELTQLVAKTSAKGTFSVQFPDGTSKLDGTFDVVSCPTGHEP